MIAKMHKKLIEDLANSFSFPWEGYFLMGLEVVVLLAAGFCMVRFLIRMEEDADGRAAFCQWAKAYPKMKLRTFPYLFISLGLFVFGFLTVGDFVGEDHYRLARLMWARNAVMVATNPVKAPVVFVKDGERSATLCGQCVVRINQKQMDIFAKANLPITGAEQQKKN